VIDLTRHVADIVVDRPLAARVFERHAIDYCCHGDRPLADAAADAGVDVRQIADELDAVARGATGAGSALPDDIGGLIGHVVSVHHTYLRRELPRLGDLMTKVVAAHAERHPEVLAVQRTLDELTADLLPHLLKEERMLFPMTIELLGSTGASHANSQPHCGSISNPIGVMHVEHDRVGELLAQLRRSTDGFRPPADACPTWHALDAGLAELEHDVHTHVHIENNVLFPAIERLEASLAAT
jgi:regulator of cell morphogenesis and NO signaling